jgi:hypothetical protein
MTTKSQATGTGIARVARLFVPLCAVPDSKRP